jgi:hypothetical protein
MLDSLRKELLDTKEHATDLKSLKEEQVKILGKYV